MPTPVFTKIVIVSGVILMNNATAEHRVVHNHQSLSQGTLKLKAFFPH